MGVTRLERKGRKNKTVAKVRVATIKRLKSKVTVESPNKEDSGVIIGDVMDVLSNLKAKPAAKKAAPAKASAATAAAEAPKASAKSDGDKLTKIEGIGPKINELLNGGGVHTFSDLASADTKDLKKILEDAGPRFKMHDPGSWPRQSKLAADGKWDELKKLQDELDGGR